MSNPSISTALTISKTLEVSVERLFEQDVVDIVHAKDGTAGDPCSLARLDGSFDRRLWTKHAREILATAPRPTSSLHDRGGQAGLARPIGVNRLDRLREGRGVLNRAETDAKARMRHRFVACPEMR